MVHRKGNRESIFMPRKSTTVALRKKGRDAVATTGKMTNPKNAEEKGLFVQERDDP